MKIIDPIMLDLTNPSIRFYWMWTIAGLWILWHLFGLKQVPSLIKNVSIIVYHLVRLFWNSGVRLFNFCKSKRGQNDQE